jgi:hypothetical protein
MMNKLEKRLCIFAIVFVAIYIGAVVLTIHSRMREVEKIAGIEALEPGQGEGQMMLAELLLPMAIFFTLTVCYIIVKKRRSKEMLSLEESDEELQ